MIIFCLFFSSPLSTGKELVITSTSSLFLSNDAEMRGFSSSGKSAPSLTFFTELNIADLSQNSRKSNLPVIFQLQSLQQFGGVSATHLDWTMVPYVRKSFYKHFMDGIKYIEEMDCFFDLGNKEEISIEDERYKKFPKSYNYAMDKTKKELQQAVEGMYHNLKIWA